MTTDDDKLKKLLTTYAAQYETAAFLSDDPSRYMHLFSRESDCEVAAFLASCLSYGSRSQFMPRIEWLLRQANGQPSNWVLSGAFADAIADDENCFYRLYTNRTMLHLLAALRNMLQRHGSIGRYVADNASDGLGAVAAITRFFAAYGLQGVVPKDTSSACKRVCMFMRWMVRDGSPVDLGLWRHIIDKRTLIMPLDTHVVGQAVRLGLLRSRSASMSAARRLTAKMAEFFPDDPLKGDFALFGYGVNHK